MHQQKYATDVHHSHQNKIVLHQSSQGNTPLSSEQNVVLIQCVKELVVLKIV
jgi:hypothetical protein